MATPQEKAVVKIGAMLKQLNDELGAEWKTLKVAIGKPSMVGPAMDTFENRADVFKVAMPRQAKMARQVIKLINFLSLQGQLTMFDAETVRTMRANMAGVSKALEMASTRNTSFRKLFMNDINIAYAKINRAYVVFSTQRH